MESSTTKTALQEKKRALRVRAHLHGTSSKPRLCVVKTNKHIHVQLIDDVTHSTLASASTVAKEIRGTEHAKKSRASARFIGESIAEKALALGITQGIFDRGSSKFHGLLKELAEGARAKGLQV